MLGNAVVVQQAYIADPTAANPPKLTCQVAP
jgi:hypothetical protein